VIRSLDANVVLRAILQDDAVQTPIAEQILRAKCSLLPTALLEIVWVLSARENWPRDQIVESLNAVFDLPHFELRNAEAVRWALGRYGAGADFADMLHLALSTSGETFATFDKGIARYGDGAPVPVETL
jgi:predicted nucleic-acid-binding protein